MREGVTLFSEYPSVSRRDIRTRGEIGKYSSTGELESDSRLDPSLSLTAFLLRLPVPNPPTIAIQQPQAELTRRNSARRRLWQHVPSHTATVGPSGRRDHISPVAAIAWKGMTKSDLHVCMCACVCDHIRECIEVTRSIDEERCVQTACSHSFCPMHSVPPFNTPSAATRPRSPYTRKTSSEGYVLSGTGVRIDCEVSLAKLLINSTCIYPSYAARRILASHETGSPPTATS